MCGRWAGCEKVMPTLSLSCSSHRLEDLTLRDLAKQEREKAANSLEAFIFETQVSGRGQQVLPAPGTCTWGHVALILAPKLTPYMDLCSLLGQALPT